MSKRSSTRTAAKRTHKSGMKHGQGYVMRGPRCLSDEEMQILRDYVDEKSDAAVVFGADPEGKENEDSETRRSNIRFIEPGDLPWVRKRLNQLLKAANQIYRFDVDSVQELQIAKYDASNNGFFDWHMDIAPGLQLRKISLSIPLNSPTEFDGGQFEYNDGVPRSVEQVQGCAISFPSYLLHRVSPVTRGCRYSLVGWAHGPDWR